MNNKKSHVLVLILFCRYNQSLQISEQIIWCLHARNMLNSRLKLYFCSFVHFFFLTNPHSKKHGMRVLLKSFISTSPVRVRKWTCFRKINFWSNNMDMYLQVFFHEQRMYIWIIKGEVEKTFLLHIYKKHAFVLLTVVLLIERITLKAFSRSNFA